MLDIKLIREQTEIVWQDLKKRGDKTKLKTLTELVNHDREWRKLLTQVNDLRHKRRETTQRIASLRKVGSGIDEQIMKGRQLDAQLATLEKQLATLKMKRDNNMMRLPNLLHETVPIGTESLVTKVYGDPPRFNFPAKNHLEIAKNLGIIDEKRGAKVAGRGFYYLKGELVSLDFALQQFAIDFMTNKGYKLVAPPYMLRSKPYEGVTDMEDFKDVMYKVEENDLYMIATSEHPLASMFMNEVLLKDELPIKIVGVSPCFRKEVGTHGKYTKGLFRMHQFNKVEQFIFCLPDQSWNLHEELQRNAESLFESLELHYKTAILPSEDTGFVQSKTYDILAWMADDEYREVGSNSNCTDFQARRLRIRYREKEGQAPIGFVHTLNSTAVATSRTMLAILEQHQQEDGTVHIPRVLRAYMKGAERLKA